MTPIEAAICRRAFRQLWKGAAICAVVFGGTVASSALSYASSFPTEASREQLLAVTAGSSGLAVLLGPLSSIDTVGGYTFYKSWVTVTAVGAIWALLAATRLLRGEEESGRWALMLSGGTRVARATAATLVALCAAVAIIFAGTAALTIAAGRSSEVNFAVRDSVLLALSVTIAPAVFVMVGACTSQLCRTRRLATGVGLAVFALSLALRMIGDAGASTHWVLWLTPLGWTDLVQPFNLNNTWPLLPAAITILALGATATALSTRRDVGGAMLATRDSSDPRPFGLRSATGLAARLDLAVLTAWVLGAATAGLFLGVVARLTTTAASMPQSVTDMLAKFGVHSDFTRGYFAIVFLLVATVVALLPASQLGAAAAEETSGRLIHLLARPTERSVWFAGRLALTATAVMAAGLLAGVGTWVGGATQGVDIGFSSTVGAGLNVIPTALLTLGIGAIVLAIAPRAAAGVVYTLVAGSLIVDLLGSMVPTLSWLGQINVFHYMAQAPANDVDPVTISLTIAMALLLCVTATVLFNRRDLRTH